MARISRGVTSHARHKKVLKLAKGYRGRSKNNYRLALQRVEKGLQYAYRDRRNRKRDFRGLWIQRINAGARQHGLTYSQLMHGIRVGRIEGRPEGAGRLGGARAGGVRRPGRPGTGPRSRPDRRGAGATRRHGPRGTGRQGAPFCVAPAGNGALTKRQASPADTGSGRDDLPGRAPARVSLPRAGGPPSGCRFRRDRSTLHEPAAPRRLRLRLRRALPSPRR